MLENTVYRLPDRRVLIDMVRDGVAYYRIVDLYDGLLQAARTRVDVLLSLLEEAGAEVEG